MSKRRTYDRYEARRIVEDAGFGYVAHSDVFFIMIGDTLGWNWRGVPILPDGTSPVADLDREMTRVRAYREQQEFDEYIRAHRSEDIVLARYDDAHAIAHLSWHEDRWYIGHDFWTGGGGTARLSMVRENSYSFPDRASALHHSVTSMRRRLVEGAIADHAWKCGPVRKACSEMLTQLNATYPPAGTQLTLF